MTRPFYLEPQALAALANSQCFLTRLAPFEFALFHQQRTMIQRNTSPQRKQGTRLLLALRACIPRRLRRRPRVAVLMIS